jgi:hypothetical protein
MQPFPGAQAHYRPIPAQGHLCKIAIGSLMMIETFDERLLARSEAVARP